MIVKYDSLNRFEKPKLILCNPGAKYTNGRLTNVLGTLSDYDSEEIVFNFNSTSDLNFRIYKVDHDDPERNAHCAFLYNAVKNKRLIFAENIGFFVIDDTNVGYDGLINYIDVTAHSAEAEIEQKKVPYIENNTYRFRTGVGSEAQQEGLLDTLVSLLPQWEIGDVDDAVAERYRTFEDVSIDANILSFMLQDMQNAYECIFVFDTINRVVNVYDQNNYVHLTNIHLTKDDLIDALHIEENSGDVYTAVSVLGGENITIGAVNPLGTNTIYDFTYYLDWMSESLSTKVRNWQQLVAEKESEYYSYSIQYYNKLDECSVASQSLQQLHTQITIYKRLRANIVAGSSAYALAEYNQVILENGGIAVPITENITAMLAQIDTLISNCNSEISTLNQQLDAANEELDALETSVRGIVESVAITNYFTQEEYDELYYYIFEGSYTDDYVIITDIMTPIERFEQMKILYDRAKSQLKRVSKPTQQFTLDVENFIFAKEFEHWSEQLETGCLINVELDNDDIAPLFLTNMTINYDDHALSMTFGNRFNKYDPKTLFENVLGGINKSANTLNYLKETVYPIKSGEFNAMREQIQASRNLTMDAALSSENEEVTIDGSGYTGREKISDDEYDPRQVKLTGKSLVFTDDAWETCKVAIGQIILNDGTVTYGVNAETIIGDLIIGNQLVIKDNDGNDLFTIIDNKVSSEISTISERLSQMIVDTQYTYCVRDFGVAPSANDPDWSVAFPDTWGADQRIWRKTTVTYEDGDTEVKAIEDITGARGDDGISVTSVVIEYALSGSDERFTPMIYPGDDTIAGNNIYPSVNTGWSTTPQDYVEDHYYWHRLVTTYSDGSIVYGDPTLDKELNDLWKVTSATRSSLTQTQESITGLVERVISGEGNVDSLRKEVSTINQRADDIELSVTEVKRDYVSKDELGYDSATQTFEQGSILDMTSQAITASVWRTEEGQYVYETVANLDENGLSVSTQNSDSTSTLNGDGVLVTKQVEGETVTVAKFTKEIAYTNNLQIATFATIGAHRFEAIEDHEWDYPENGTAAEKAEKTTVGTGLAWIGKQEELIEVQEA